MKKRTLWLAALTATALASCSRERAQDRVDITTKYTKETVASDIPEEIRPLVARLLSPNSHERQNAAIELGKMPEKAVPAVPYLVRMLDDNGGLDGAMRTLLSGRTEYVEHRTPVGRTVIRQRVTVGQVHIDPYYYAHQSLLTIGRPAIPTLTWALNDRTWRIRLRAARLCGEIRDVRAVGPLLSCLEDHDSPSVQEEAARSLGKLGDKRAVEPLILALKSTEFDSVVAAVTNSLGRLGDNRAVNPIVSYLREKGTIAKDEKSITAGESHALLALGRIGSPEAIAFLLSGASARRARSPQQNMAGSLAPRGDALAIRDLVSAYKVTSGSIRVAITAAIEGEKDPRAFDALLTALRSGDPELGGAAAVALGRTGDHRAFDTLVAVFKEQSEPVSAKAAEGLGQLKDPRAVEPLMVAVREFLNGATHSGSFILSCVEALGELRDPRAVDTLVSVLEKWTLGPALAEEAVRSLGKTKDPAAIQALNAAKKSDRPEVVAAARRELAEIDEVGE